MLDLIVGFFTGKPRSQQRGLRPRPMAWAIVLATIPAGWPACCSRTGSPTEARNPLLIACTAIVYGLLLGWSPTGGGEQCARSAAWAWRTPC